MVAFTDTAGPVTVCFTERADGCANADGFSPLSVPVARMHQVHGATVVAVAAPERWWPDADGLMTGTPGLALAARAADCVPVLLADPDAGLVAAVHAGRAGVAGGVVGQVVAALRERGAGALVAWVGPHVCGACYEVPAALQQEVAALVPETRATTRRGTPALDLGAGVRAQLAQEDIAATSFEPCTLEDQRFWSHRRDATRHRQAGVIAVTP